MNTRTKNRAVMIVAATASCYFAYSSPAARPAPFPRPPTPHDPIATQDCRRGVVDLVICLDTSGSMTALLDSARAKLWDIVNEIAKADPVPVLRVGLLTYGSPNRSTAAAGWIVRQSALTTDLDTIYSRMMALTTNGGDEFVGWVLNDAVKTMNWSSEPNAVKLIFVAGNESADQAAHLFNFRHVAEIARGNGIVINAIYAGTNQQGISEHWDQVGLHGGGSYTAIDMRCGTVQITTPHDRILIQLNAELNATYIPYGRQGKVGFARQRKQDEQAAAMGGQSGASRVAAKATAMYRNEHWDLVDAAEGKDFDLSAVAPAALPAELRAMTITEQRTYIEAKRDTRTVLQKKIEAINVKRSTFLEREHSRGATGGTSLDDAIRVQIRKEMAKKGYKFGSSK